MKRLQTTLTNGEYDILFKEAKNLKLPMPLYVMTKLLPDNDDVKEYVKIFNYIIEKIDLIKEGEQFQFNQLIEDISFNSTKISTSRLGIWLHAYIKENRTEISILNKGQWGVFYIVKKIDK